MGLTRNEKARAWKSGETGIALVDAMMRQLWETGWMHIASVWWRRLFLPRTSGFIGVKARAGLRRPWWMQIGQTTRLAGNGGGCGTDAAPYYRIFNPATQAKKFDADGSYVDRWLADRAAFPPIADLKLSRARALERYRTAIRHPRLI